MNYKYNDYGLYLGMCIAEVEKSTTIEPPAPQGRLRPRWNGTNWTLVEDWMGVAWFNQETLLYESSVNPDDKRSLPWVEVVSGVITHDLPPSPHHTFNYTTKQWVDPRTAATEWDVVRAKRDKLLAASDFTQLPDTPQDKHTWAVYRQALRDITKQPNPFAIDWPVAP